MLRKDVVLAVLYLVYLVKQGLSLVDTVKFSLMAWACLESDNSFYKRILF